ncbi:hypothetical protein [Dyella jejuensis]|uniref:hypothetical protein n=1 Tax=Dyella jejuensis TaxID=1432009 RepID=UPI00384DDED8
MNPAVTDNESVVGCEPLAIDNAASPIVVGFCTIQKNGKTRNQAMRWTSSGGTYTATALDDLAGHECAAVSVNVNGDAVGTCADADGDPRAVYWAGSGTSVEKLDAKQGIGIEINDSGNLVIDKLTDEGYSRVFTGTVDNLPLKDIGVPDGGYNCSAVGEDESGDIAANCDGQPGVSKGYFYGAKLKQLIDTSDSVTSNITGMASGKPGSVGDIIGNLFNSSGHPQGFEYDPADDEDVRLSAPKSSPRAASAQATSVPSAVKPNYGASCGSYGCGGGGYGGGYKPSSLPLSWFLNGAKQSSSNGSSFAFYQSKGQCKAKSKTVNGVTGVIYECTA